MRPVSCIRLGRAFLRDPFSVPLRVNAGAAGEEQERLRKHRAQMFRAFEIDFAIRFRASASRTRALDHDIEIARRVFRPPHDP